MTFKTTHRLLTAFLALFICSVTLRAEDKPLPSVGIEVAFPKLKFEKPMLILPPTDGSDRLFVIEQKGRVVWFDNNADTDKAHVALDLRKSVRSDQNEEGLLGIAFDPNFKQNRYVYLHFTRYEPKRNVLARFEMDEDLNVIKPSSEKVILEVPQPYWNHNGGMIAFGKDGFLYIILGDGGAANDPHGNGQNLSTLLGSMLRIDVHPKDDKPYAIPADNPFVKKEGARPEIYAYGLRNAWRFSFDRKTGDLWAGDVGQNLWEEVNIIKKGGNYGWNAREGFHPFTGGKGEGPFQDPIHEYPRKDGVSITGGYVYRGKAIPELQGKYTFGDFQLGNVWALEWDGKKMPQRYKLGVVPTLASFGEDRDGEVYLCSLNGMIYKFVKK